MTQNETRPSVLAELKRRNVFRVGAAYLVMAWLLAQVADVALGAFAAPEWVMRSILVLLLIGLPLALFFAWAYELTPEGIKKERDVDRARSITAQTGRKLDYLILAGIGLLALVVVGDRLVWQRETPTASDRTPTPSAIGLPADEAPLPRTRADGSAAHSDNIVAVLPFANRSSREDDAFFAAGVHDDLLTRLSKISALGVISRTSVSRYADTKKPIPEIAAELGAAVVMEGAVQRAGERVRINVQLIDGFSDTHLWAENYDRELTADNLFDIQAEIAHGIASAMEAVLTGADEDTLAAIPTNNLAAYDAYIRGNLLALFENANEDRYRAAIAAYDEALRLDPGFAAAFTGKAMVQLSLYWYQAQGVAYRTAAWESLEQALRLAPEAVETLTALGYYHYWGFLDYARAEDFLNQAVAKAPNHVDAWLAKAFVARRDGRYADAIVALERALALDPLNAETLIELTDTYSNLGEFARAGAIIRRAEAISPDSSRLSQFYWRYWWRQGEIERAWEAMRDPVSGADVYVYMERFSVALLTRRPENIERALAQWPDEKRRPKNYLELYEISRAQALLAAGRHDEARALLRDVKARLDAMADPYPAGWAANVYYYPVDLPGLMGDGKGVRAAAQDYEQHAPRDAWAQLDIYPRIAAAYARVGEPESALAYLERLADKPWLYLSHSIEPAFDPLRDHPRYRAMKAAYEAWAAARERPR